MLTDFRGFEIVNALVVQPDGKLVAAGDVFRASRAAFALARYNPDGSLDRSFGKAGRVRRNFLRTEGLLTALVTALVLQPDGKLVAAVNPGSEGPSRRDDVFLKRFNANGSLDTSFGAGGVVRADFGGSGNSLVALVLQPDGKLVAAGARRINNAVFDLILARYNPDGSLDASFGTGGFVVESRGDSGSALVLQPDGKLVAADVDGQLFRFNPDGTLDTSFGDSGRVGPNFGSSEGAQLVLQPDGKLVVGAGPSNTDNTTDFLLARFNPDGSLDTSFGTGGLVGSDFGPEVLFTALVLQPDGKLVAGGALFRPSLSLSDFIVARYHPDGSLDASFGNGGAVRTRLRGLRALALQADGRLVAAGERPRDPPRPPCPPAANFPCS